MKKILASFLEDLSGGLLMFLASLLLPITKIKFQPGQRPLDLCELVKSILRRAKYLEEEFGKSALKSLTHFLLLIQSRVCPPNGERSLMGKIY